VLSVELAGCGTLPPGVPSHRPLIVLYTSVALVAFAANSVLARLALVEDAIDAASFTSVRLISGATMLLLVVVLGGRRPAGSRGSWISAGALFLYAVAFSFAYVSLSAGTGARILFGAVQATMIGVALASGDRPHPLQWLGLLLALAGLIYLVLPGLAAPPPVGAALMGAAGIAWGVYSLRGRTAADPLADTAGNFARTVPLVLAVSAVSLLVLGRGHLSGAGMVLAAVSGAVTSGLGYVIWYAALGGLTATRAATVQLSVPVLAAGGGVLFLSERITLRLVLSAIMILGGIALTVAARERLARAAVSPVGGVSSWACFTATPSCA
jgi:drug/metabolite transporter (DMT)-like permease